MPIRPGLGGVLHFRQHQAVQIGARVLDDHRHVPVGPFGSPVIDADDPGLAGPVAGIERIDDQVPGALFNQRCTCVLQVEEHLVGRQALRLLQEARIASGDREAGTP
jgi:hypothetical protein